MILNNYMCERNPSSPNNNNPFSIHLLKNFSFTISDIIETDIDDLEIKNEAWIETEDIDFYDYSTHCIYLKNNKNVYFREELGISMNNQPFLVILNSKRHYIGSFHGGALAIAPTHPYIDELSINFFPSDVLYIAPSWNSDSVDVRNNMYIRENLENLDKLHEGLTLTITEIQIVDNSDTSTVKYKYIIKNNDQDDLLVIDPQKMGSDLFHYYTNGINFSGEGIIIGSKYKTVSAPDPFDSWELDWFTKIQAGHKMERTVTLKGYPKIPKGQYNCLFRFANPTNIEKESRYKDDARIWIGYIKSKPKVVEIN